MKEKYREATFVDRMEIELTEDQEQKLTNWINTKKTAIENDREEFISRQQKYLANFDDFINFDRESPWEGASALHMPLTSIMVKAYHSKLYNIFEQEDTAQYIPREGYDDDHAAWLKKLRSWYIYDYINGYKGIRGFWKEVSYDAVTVGFGIGMKTWESKQRKIIDIVENELSREMADMEPQAQEAMKTGRKISVKSYKEVPKIIDVFEGSRMVSVPFENFYMPNAIPESNDLDHPKMVLVQTPMTVSQIKLKAKQKAWDSKKCTKIINEGKTRPYTRAQNVKDQRGQQTGYDDNESIYDNEERLMEYAFCTYDIDEDGIDEEIVVTRSEKGTIAKVVFLDRISPSGMRPLYKFDCFTKPRQAYSRGIPEFVYPLNEEMDLIHNMRLNYMALQTCPFGSYRAASSLKNEPIRIAPGKFIPVDDTADLKILGFQTNAQVLAGEEDRLWNYADRQVSVSSLAQGIVPSTVGPTRSTSGVITLLQQMDKEFKSTVDSCAAQWKKMELMLMDDLDRRIPLGLKMRVLGASVTEFIDQQDPDQLNAANVAMRVNGAFDVSIKVAEVVHSEEVRRNEATIILDKIVSPSLLQQFGIIGPKAMHKAFTDWVKAYDRNPDDYADAPQFIQVPLTLYQEIQLCGQGKMPMMSMMDDHQAKAQQLAQFVQEPDYMQAKAQGLYSPKVDDYMARTIQKHLQLAQQLDPKGLPNNLGTNGQNYDQLQSGTAPQQGGNDVRRTTSRNSDGASAKNPVQPEGVAGSSPASDGSKG